MLKQYSAGGDQEKEEQQGEGGEQYLDRLTQYLVSTGSCDKLNKNKKTKRVVFSLLHCATYKQKPELTRFTNTNW